MKSERIAAFILSAQRSGSTWMGYVLGSHGDSAFLGEYSRAWGVGTAVPCTPCTAAGLSECKVLHGIDAVPADEAFKWAFERTAKRVLVDASKSIEWAERFSSVSADIDVRFIHLVRDPRGWFASQRRRLTGISDAQMIEEWRDENMRIWRFAETAGRPCRVVFYEELADQLLTAFPPLFAFLGLPFERSALEYWNVVHHGYAANGATSAILSKGNYERQVSHFATGDDSFYAKNDRSRFTDRRWREQLSAEQLAMIVSNARVNDLLQRMGRKLTETGIAVL